jgi:hypothetical protein
MLRKTLWGAAVCVAAGTSSYAVPLYDAFDLKKGDTVEVLTTPGRLSNGGEFKLVALTGESAGQSARSFCVETTEYLSFGRDETIWEASIRNIEGTGDFSDSGPPAFNFSIIHQETAFLYTQFFNTDEGLGDVGSLVKSDSRLREGMDARGYGPGFDFAMYDYNYADDTARGVDGKALQQAIWSFEVTAPPTLNAQASFYKALAEVAVAEGVWSGFGKVAVANIYTGSATNPEWHQGQLFMTRSGGLIIPEPATLALAGLGLLSLSVRQVRRRTRA